MEIRITQLDDTTHRAAKILAAHTGVSLNTFLCDAIHHECLRVAHQRGLTELVIHEIEKPAGTKARKPVLSKVKGPARP